MPCSPWKGQSTIHSKPDVLVRYETTFDRQFKSAVRLLEARAKHRKPSAKPYFPSHPFGQTWKSEEIASTIPTQQVDEKK